MEETEANRAIEGVRRVKTVAAREVLDAEFEAIEAVAAENIHAANAQMPVIDIPSAVPRVTRDASIVDPTAYSERTRKRSHHRLFRATQALTGVSFALSGLSFLFMAFPDDSGLAWALVVGGLLCAGAAMGMVGMTQLNKRTRGYAYASGCVAALALLLVAFTEFKPPGTAGGGHGEKAPVHAPAKKK